jgi:hypothetical protein
MKIERDKVYLTKAGKKKRVVAVDAPGKWPIVIVAADGEVASVGTRTVEGRVKLDGGESLDDLVKEYREPKVIYVNEYWELPNSSVNEGFVYSNKEAAEKAGMLGALRKAVKYVEVIEEEG